MNVDTPSGPVTVQPAGGQRFASTGGGDAGKFRTARIIAALAKAQQFDPLVIETAQALALTVAPRDVDGIVYAIRRFMLDNFHFVEDTRDADAVREPSEQLAIYHAGGTMRGDCDCAAALGVALGLAVGRDARLVLVQETGAPTFTHIYAEVLGLSGWIDLDTTAPAGFVPSIARQVTVGV